MDAYRKIRNTLRYALGNLDGFDPATDSVADHELLEIDRWALASLDEVIAKVVEGVSRMAIFRLRITRSTVFAR